MKPFFILSFLCCFFASCQPKNSHSNTLDVIHAYSKIIKKEHGIICSSYGLHYAGPDKVYDGKIHTINLGYRIDKRMQYKDAKKLFYQVVDGLLAYLNKDEKIRKYFFHYPLTYEDLELRLSFDYESQGFLKRNDVYSICISENEITYFLANIDGVTHKITPTETYPGMGTLSISEQKSTRSITRKLPEIKE